MTIFDSGNRREFETGAVRDVGEGKGRCDLLPLDIVAEIVMSPVLDHIDAYIRSGDTDALVSALEDFVGDSRSPMYRAMLDVSLHFEEGAKKYAERNWEKGIPLHCYIDSAVRHYIKWELNDYDEPHDRAFMWNILCAMWTHKHRPEMIDLPFKSEEGEGYE